MNEQAQKLATKLIAEQIGMLIIESKTAEADRYFLVQENQTLKKQLEDQSTANSGKE